MKVLFIGGPLDGQWCEVPKGLRVWRCLTPMPHCVASFNETTIDSTSVAMETEYHLRYMGWHKRKPVPMFVRAGMSETEAAELADRHSA